MASRMRSRATVAATLDNHMRRNPHLDLSSAEKAYYGRDDGDPSTYAPAPVAPYDPYAPSSDDYAARSREDVIECHSGIVRIDYGGTP